MVYISIVISGREKYEFEADVVGVFTSKKKAIKMLLKKLIEDEHISALSYIENNDLEEKVDEDDYETIFELMSKECNTEEDLQNIVKLYENSYYGNGWKYVIRKMEITE